VGPGKPLLIRPKLFLLIDWLENKLSSPRKHFR